MTNEDQATNQQNVSVVISNWQHVPHVVLKVHDNGLLLFLEYFLWKLSTDQIKIIYLSGAHWYTFLCPNEDDSFI